MNPDKTTEPIETSLAHKILAAVQSWQAQMPAEASLADCAAGAQQLAWHLAQLALNEQLAQRQAAAPAVSSLLCSCGRRQALQRQQARWGGASSARSPMCARIITAGRAGRDVRRWMKHSDRMRVRFRQASSASWPGRAPLVRDERGLAGKGAACHHLKRTAGRNHCRSGR
jgi:hypothetical protein